MTRDEIIGVLDANKARLAELGVASLKLFGSFGRDAAHTNSDIDLIVAFDGLVTFDRFMDLKLFLEDSLGHSIDLGTEDMIRPELRPVVEHEAICVA